MAWLKHLKQSQWLKALLLVSLMWFHTGAAHAQYTIVTPPNSGSHDGPSGESFTWTVPSPAPGATIGGYMQLNATAHDCCSIATIRVNGTPPPAGSASYSFGFWATVGATYNFTITSDSGVDVGFGWDFRPSPVNDNFANAIDVTTVPNPDPSAAPNTAYAGSFTGEGSNATLEPSDPMTNGDIWYKWTAPATGQVVWGFSSTGGGSGDCNIYGGTALTNLTSTGNPFWTVAGTTYYVAISRGGTFSLSWTLHPSPANDNFANAPDLSAAPNNSYAGSGSGDTAYATRELGDPFIGADVWYKWTAPANGAFSLGAVRTVVLAIFTPTLIAGRAWPISLMSAALQTMGD